MSTKIEWTNETWNPIVGCSRVSDGCRNCYAERMAYRLACMGVEPYAGGVIRGVRDHWIAEALGRPGPPITRPDLLEKIAAVMHAEARKRTKSKKAKVEK